MLKYILIWLCIGYVVMLIYFIYYYNFDVNKMFDDSINFKKWGLTDEEYEEITSSNIFVQIVVGITVIVLIITWPMLIVDFVRTFKRKLR